MRGLRAQLLPVFTFARIDVKRLFRDKVAIFFTLVFPLIFLLVFGGLFGRDTNVSFDVALINGSKSQFASEFSNQLKGNELFKVDEKITDLNQAKEEMNQGELDAAIVLDEQFGEIANVKYPSGQAKVIYDENNATAAQTLESVLESIFKDINAQLVPADVPFTVTAESTATKGLTQFDYIFSGLLGFALLTLGVFGPTSVYPRLKQKGVLRRYKTTTLKVWQYFLANILSNAVYGLLSVAAMFTVAVFLFDLDMQGDYISLVLFVILSTAVLFGIGLAVGGWAKNENQAAPLANLITFPMMFLSGTFFPRFLMPDWLQNVSAILPLTPVIDGARLIITEGKTIFEIAPQVGLLVIWGVIIYIIAIRTFRWE